MNRKGFTLIEVLVTITIIAILSGVGVISYRTFFDSGKENYYKSLESNILLSASDYFLDHRDLLPVTSYYTEKKLSDLIEKKYIEEVKDSKGNPCTGRIIAYKEDKKYSYSVCLECSDYESEGKYCKEEIPSTISITAWETGTSNPYNATASFEKAQYTHASSITVQFDMQNVEVGKYEITNTKTNEKITCLRGQSGSNWRWIEGNKCQVDISKTGTYNVKSYNTEGNLLIRNQYINIKILESNLSFDVEVPSRNKIDCSSGNKTKVTFKVVKNPNKLSEEWKRIDYRLERNGVNYGSGSIDDSFTKELNLESGRYKLYVDVIDQNDKKTSLDTPKQFDVYYEVNYRYTDNNQTGHFDVVQGQKYSLLNDLPLTRAAYDFSELKIRWHLDDGNEYTTARKITGDTIVENGCSYNIVGLMSIEIENRDIEAGEYCQNVTYDGSPHTITIAAPDHVTFSNHTEKTNADTYTVTAAVEKTKYIWKDDTFGDKHFDCELKKKTLTCPSSPSDKNYNGSNQSSGITCPTGSSAGGDTLKKNANTYYQTCTADSNHKFNSECKVSWKIKKVDASITCTNPTPVYNGSEKTIASCSGGSISNHKRTPAGSQTVTCTGDDNHNTVTKSCSVAQAQLTCPSSPADKTFNNQNQGSGVSCPGGSSAGGTTSATNADTYYHTCTADNNHYFASTCSVKWVINKKSIGSCPSSPADKTYTGGNITSGVSCPTGSTTGGTTSASAVGSYTQTCTGTGNYTGSCSISWKIVEPPCSKTWSCGTWSYYTSCSGDEWVASGGSLPSVSNYSQGQSVKFYTSNQYVKCTSGGYNWNGHCVQQGTATYCSQATCTVACS